MRKSVVFSLSFTSAVYSAPFVEPHNHGTPHFPDYLVPTLQEHNFCIYQNRKFGPMNPALCIHSDDAKVDIKADTNTNALYIGGKMVIDRMGRWVSDPTGLKGDKGDRGDKGDKGDPGPKGSFSECVRKIEQIEGFSKRLYCDTGYIVSGGGCWCGVDGIVSTSLPEPYSSQPTGWYCKCLQWRDGKVQNALQTQVQVICCKP